MNNEIFTSYTVYEVNHTDLNKLIADHYSLDEFSCHRDTDNHTNHVFMVDGFGSDSFRDRIDEIIESKGCHISQVFYILNEMAENEVIVPARYSIFVGWDEDNGTDDN